MGINGILGIGNFETRTATIANASMNIGDLKVSPTVEIRFFMIISRLYIHLFVMILPGALKAHSFLYVFFLLVIPKSDRFGEKCSR